MPSYDYLCPKCNTVVDISHKITEEPEIKCAKCNTTCKKQISRGIVFVLRGEGWPGKELKNGKNAHKEQIKS